MIRLATESDFPPVATNECLTRILGLKTTYGADVSFVHYYTDGEGGLMSLMDGIAVLHLESVTEEWIVFLGMNPDIAVVHCSDSIGRSLMETTDWRGRVGDVMLYQGEVPSEVDEIVKTEVHLPTVYALLKDHFPGISPFEYWYTDVSHRVRHGHCHIAVIVSENKVVSNAMTVAETNTAAVLGQIATHPDFRRRGWAGKCINSTISQCKDKNLYILPINETAQRLYEKLGFVTVGGWAELQRT